MCDNATHTIARNLNFDITRFVLELDCNPVFVREMARLQERRRLNFYRKRYLYRSNVIKHNFVNKIAR